MYRTTGQPSTLNQNYNFAAAQLAFNDNRLGAANERGGLTPKIKNKSFILLRLSLSLK
jgi:hypothetical protein